MMRSVPIAILLALLCCQPVQAGELFVSGGCGTGNNGQYGIPNDTVDQFGQVCVSAVYGYTNIISNTTVTLKSGAGILHAVVINTKGASSNTLTLFDSATASGNKIGTLDTTSAVGAVLYDIQFSNGLTIVTATGTAPNVTVAYR
jgi:hypothetical protein